MMRATFKVPFSVTLDYSRPGKPKDNVFIVKFASRPFHSTASSALNV